MHSGNADFQAEYWNTICPYGVSSKASTLHNVSTIEYWDMSPAATTPAAQGAVRLYWENISSLNIVDVSTGGDLKVAHWTAGAWEDKGSSSVCSTCNGPAPAHGWIQGANQSTFSPETFGSGSGSNPLPVQLLFFNTRCLNAKVTADWATASEQNSSHFTLEKSADGTMFSPVNTINAAGNSSTTLKYSSTDVDPYHGTSYYRLRETDLNGTSETFPISSVVCSDNPEFAVDVNSNPLSQGAISVSVKGAADKNVLLVLTDVYGRELYSHVVINTADSYLFSINISSEIAPGIYFITASDNDRYISRKIIVK